MALPAGHGSKIEASSREWIMEKFDRGPIKAYKSLDHRQNFLKEERF